MLITIDTSADLSATDEAVLRLLLGEADAPAPTKTEAKPKPARTAKKAAAKPEPEPEPEADEEPEEDLLGSDEPTRADAVEVATKLVSNGEAAKVKAELEKHGAKRVSELADEDIAAFVNALR